MTNEEFRQMTNEEFRQKVKQLISNISLDPSVNLFIDVFQWGKQSRSSHAKSKFNEEVAKIQSENDVNRIYEYALSLLGTLASLRDEFVGHKPAHQLSGELFTLLKNYHESQTSEIKNLKKELTTLTSEISGLDQKVSTVDINVGKIQELQTHEVATDLQNLKLKLINLEQDFLRYNELKADIIRLEQATSLSLTQELNESLLVVQELATLKTKIIAIKNKLRELDQQARDSFSSNEQQRQQIETLRGEIRTLQTQISILQAQNQELSLSEQRLGISNESLQRENDTAKGAERFQTHSAFRAFVLEERLKLVESVTVPVEFREEFSFTDNTEAKFKTFLGALVSRGYVRQVPRLIFYQPEILAVAPSIKNTVGYRDYVANNSNNTNSRLLEASIVELDETANPSIPSETEDAGGSSSKKRSSETSESASSKPKRPRRNNEAAAPPPPFRSPASRAAK